MVTVNASLGKVFISVVMTLFSALLPVLVMKEECFCQEENTKTTKNVVVLEGKNHPRLLWPPYTIKQQSKK